MPFLVRIEYWSGTDWTVGHSGIGLIDPEAYIAALTKRGTIARAVDPFTKAVVAPIEEGLEDLL